MWRFLRKKKEELSKSFANDLLAASGKLPLQSEFIRYRITPGVTADFDQWLQSAYQACQKIDDGLSLQDLPCLHFVYATASGTHLPMAGVIISSSDASGRAYPFALTRILTHPLAREFRSVIPWLYRETFATMQQLVAQSWQGKTLNMLYQQVGNLRHCNSRLKRRDALEAIVQQLRYMTFDHFWQAVNLVQSPTQFIHQTTILIRALKHEHYCGIRLPLPNHHDLLPTVIFWLQLLENALGEKFQSWQVYWHPQGKHQHAAMLFFSNAISPEFIRHFIDQRCPSPKIADTLLPISISETFSTTVLSSESSLSMIKLLSRWGEVLNDR